MINRKFLFDHLRNTLFSGKLAKSQIDGITYILDVWEADHANWDDRWLAYALGTTHHETDAKMLPVNEKGGRQYFELNYGPHGRRPRYAKKMGNTQDGDGDKYHGRGYVQLTWKVNYQSMSTHLSKKYRKSIDLVGNPALALQPNYAAEIMFAGMNLGTFTKKKFSDYFTRNASGQIAKDNWTGARAIINDSDKAVVIAELSRKYYASISH